MSQGQECSDNNTSQCHTNTCDSFGGSVDSVNPVYPVSSVETRRNDMRGDCVMNEESKYCDPRMTKSPQLESYRARGRRSGVTKDTFKDIPSVSDTRPENGDLSDSESDDANNLRVAIYPRSKSCPNTDTLQSGTPSHRPLTRTASMDLSLGLMECWLQLQEDKADRKLISSLDKDDNETALVDDGKNIGHRRNSSLPLHIQRTFPELATPTRPKSPLVLHELRSRQDSGQYKTSNLVHDSEARGEMIHRDKFVEGSLGEGDSNGTQKTYVSLLYCVMYISH